MSDDEAKTSRLFDVRTIERNIRKGLTNRKDYDKYLQSLPDVAEKAAPHDAGLDSLDDDDFDDEDEDEDDEDEDEAAAASESNNHVSDGHGGTPSNDTSA